MQTPTALVLEVGVLYTPTSIAISANAPTNHYHQIHCHSFNSRKDKGYHSLPHTGSIALIPSSQIISFIALYLCKAI